MNTRRVGSRSSCRRTSRGAATKHPSIAVPRRARTFFKGDLVAIKKAQNTEDEKRSPQFAIRRLDLQPRHSENASLPPPLAVNLIEQSSRVYSHMSILASSKRPLITRIARQPGDKVLP